MTDTPQPPLANSPEARTPEGTILDQSATQPVTTPQTEPSTDAPSAPAPAPAVPDTYTFKAPEGQTFPPDLAAAATPVFKELGLTQPQADRLTELWAKTAASDADRALGIIKAQNEKWTAELKADPFLGPNIDRHRETVGRALDLVLTADERNQFAQAMDLTGAGNNPAFSRAFVKMAERVAPGTHVSGNGPSPNGQTRPGSSPKPSIASTLFPNLPHSP